eukprot:3071422-Amphidinium_carterae.1
MNNPKNRGVSGGPNITAGKEAVPLPISDEHSCRSDAVCCISCLQSCVAGSRVARSLSASATLCRPLLHSNGERVRAHCQGWHAKRQGVKEETYSANKNSYILNS